MAMIIEVTNSTEREENPIRSQRFCARLAGFRSAALDAGPRADFCLSEEYAGHAVKRA